MDRQVVIYIISLAKDIERREKISKQLNGLNITHEFIDAIWGSDVSEHELTGINFAPHFLPTVGEIGCSLSHQSAYKKMLSEGREWAIILEDDVIISPKFKDFIDNFTKDKYDKIPKNSLYILGGQEGTGYHNKISCSIFNRFNFGNVVIRKVTYAPRFLSRACCYLLNAKVATNLINAFEKEYYVADHWGYLSKKDCFDSVYFTEIISHPIVTIHNSHLEADRQNRPTENKVHKEKNEFEKIISNSFFFIKKNLRKLKF